jgi:hypothetical protein
MANPMEACTDGTDLSCSWTHWHPTVPQGLNLSLKYISPLALSLSTASEPIIGSVLGMWPAGLMHPWFKCRGYGDLMACGCAAQAFSWG